MTSSHVEVAEFHVLWEAGSKEDWEKVCEVIDSQLRPMNHKKLGEANYRTLGWNAAGLTALLFCV